MAIASTCNSTSQFARNMPDVTDVGPRQSKYPTNNKSYNESKTMKSVSKEKSEKIIVREEDLSVAKKMPTKEVKTCDDLIHLHGPCTEASIINNLRLRFTKNIFQVWVHISYNTLLNIYHVFKTWIGPVLVKICPHRYEETHAAKNDYLDSMVLGILDNNILTNKSQTVIPLGMQGAGKTWTCRMVMRSLLKKCGYGEKTDMAKYIEAADNVIRPMVTASFSDSKMSSRMVRIFFNTSSFSRSTISGIVY